jgi:putative flavoprotein involved in K+ transport
MNAPLGDVERDDYSTRADTVDRLVDRADGLPVRTHTPVTRLSGSGDELVLTTPDDELRARTVIVASGAKNRPLLPAVASQLPPHITTLHVADYRSPAALPDGAVLVVGGGQSGAQVAEDLALAGRTVWLSASRVGRYRAHYRGRELLAWHVDAGWWATRPDQVDAAAMWLPTPLLASNGRDIGLPALARLGVRPLGRLCAVEGTRLRFEGDVRAYVEYADQVALSLEQVADDYIAAAGLDAPDPEPDTGRGPLDVDPRATLDLDAVGIRSVVWTTGFGPELSWIDLPVLDERGLPVLDDGGAVGRPSVRFVGMPWQSTRASAILHGMPLDAERAVAGVTAQLA